MAHDRATEARELTTSPPPGERLQKLLARAGLGSRRSCEELIRAGRVTVDGEVATLGERADPASQEVAVDGVPIALPSADLTIAVNKPVGYVVSTSVERGQRSVYELLSDPPANLRYVGRLDADTEGVLLFTTDGELVHRLTHPRYEVDKVYEATVEGRPARTLLDRLSGGIALDDGWTSPATVEVLEAGDEATVLRLVIHEGRKRQIRRMCDAIGHPVRRLRRTAFGPITLEGIAPGEVRELTAEELVALRRLAQLPSADGGDSRWTLRSDGRYDRATSRQAREPRIGSEPLARSIAIDGPTAAGKTVVGRAVAEQLGIGFFDTGLMYRGCTLATLEAGVDPNDPDAVLALVRSLDLDMRWPEPTTPRLYLAGVDVTDQLRTPEIEQSVSLVSRVPDVRDELVRRQRAIASREPVVMAGRDIGTRVLTEARTKVFLDASSEIRARRRLGEELDAGRSSSFDQVLTATRRRDELDDSGHRAVRREQAAEDAVVIDTDPLGIDQVVAACVEAYRAANGD